MDIRRKLQTARRVLFKNGANQVLWLAADKIQALVNHFTAKTGTSIRSSVEKGFVRGTEEGKPHSKLRVLFITSLVEAECGQTVRYRIHNIREALKGRIDTRYEVVEFGGLKHDYPFQWADIVVLMRLEWSDETQSVVERARKYNKPIVFDVDDIVFLSEYTGSFCKTIRDERKETFDYYHDFFSKFEETCSACDFATTSTEYIANLMRQKGKEAFVIHNGINHRQLQIADRLRGLNKRAKGIIRISYLSGSKTHDRDFEQAWNAVMQIMREYPNARLRIAGYLDIDGIPKEFESRIERAVYMKYTRLLKYSAVNTINLAPLDTGNPFCHAKSELKYFEAAIVGVPTVASPTDTFQRVIISGANGVLASTQQEWYHAIKRLIDDQRYYDQIRSEALQHTLRNYSPKAIADEAAKVYTSIFNQYHNR